MMMMTGQMACSSPATVKPASVIAVRNLVINSCQHFVIIDIFIIVIFIIVIIVFVSNLVVFEPILVTSSGLSKSMSKT